MNIIGVGQVSYEKQIAIIDKIMKRVIEYCQASTCCGIGLHELGFIDSEARRRAGATWPRGRWGTDAIESAQGGPRHQYVPSGCGPRVRARWGDGWINVWPRS